MNKIIHIEKLVKIYNGVVPTKALNEIDLEINEGEITAIIGQSGSGKSTLLNMIGILDNPTSGKIIIDNKDISKMNKDQMAEFRNKTIGFVFQFHYLLPEFNVLENVLMPEWIKNRKVSFEKKEKAESLINLVGLSDVINKDTTKISGGQKQRVAIARSLMNEPKIILADEPTGNLDTKNTEKIYDLFCEVNKKLKTTFVLITHSTEIAKRANRIVEIKDGQIVKDQKNS